MSFVNVYQFVCVSARASACVCASFPYSFEVGMWDLIVIVRDHCLFLQSPDADDHQIRSLKR